jgi:PLD-like domain
MRPRNNQEGDLHMTDNTVQKPENQSNQHITVKKLITKGEINNPQALLVIGTTRHKGDLWVQINFEKKADCSGIPANDTISELASIQLSKGSDAPEPDSAFRDNTDQSFYDVGCEEGEALWVARFDFSEHQRWESSYDVEKDLPMLWQKIANSSKSKQKILVSAWCTEFPKDWSTKDEIDKKEKDNTLYSVPSVPSLGEPVFKQFPIAKVEQGFLFELGILFVHGIGPHKARETLTKFGEPIVKFWENWLFEVTNRSAKRYPKDQGKDFYNRVTTMAIKNCPDHDGITRWVEKLRDGSCNENGSDKIVDVGEIVCGGVRVEDVLFPDTSGNPPNSALVCLSVVGKDEKLREAHVLMSEAWWTPQTVYPNSSELFNWIYKGLPTIFLTNIRGSIEPDVRKLCRIKHIILIWLEIALFRKPSLPPGLLRKWHLKLLKMLVSNIMDLPWIIVDLLITVLVTITVKIPFILLVQPASFLIAIASQLPIPWLKRSARGLIDVLMGTVGQSYALKTSPIRQAAIVGRLMQRAVTKTAIGVRSELLMVTPFLIPGNEGMQLFKDLRNRNVRVRILTNSLKSSTVLTAQSGYMHYRMPLLKDGVELYEIRSLLGKARGSGETMAIARYGNYSLHAKMFVFDRQRVFIGSMNFDQRSMHLNTEIGLIIDSPVLAEQVAERFEAMVQPVNAYKLILRPNKSGGAPSLVWHTQEDGQAVEYDTEPARSDWQRTKANILSLLPVDDEL